MPNSSCFWWPWKIPSRRPTENPQRASRGLSWARGKGSRAQALQRHEPCPWRAQARLVQGLLVIMERSTKKFTKSTIHGTDIQTSNSKYFYSLLTFFLKMLLEIWNLWKDLRARLRHPSAVIEIFLWPWHVSLNGLVTPNTGYIATTNQIRILDSTKVF